MDAPAIRVMGWDFTYKAYIDAYESLRFGRSLWEVGSFELCMQKDQRGAEALRPDNLVYLDRDRVGLIQSVEYREADGGVTVSAVGCELKGIAARRITVPDAEDDTAFGWDAYPPPEKAENAAEEPGEEEESPKEPALAAAESVIKHYALAHMVGPKDGERRFDALRLADDRRHGMQMNARSRFEGLDELFARLGEQAGMGYCVQAVAADKPADGYYLFDVIAGRDRTVGSGSPVVFSTDWESLSDAVYTDDPSGLKNAAYAGGAGEDEKRFIQIVYPKDRVSGLERHETFLDCGNEEDADALKKEALHQLGDAVHIKNLTGSVMDGGPFTYRQDWDLGDRVTVQSRRMGVECDMIITEVTENYEPGRAEISVGFDKRKKTLLDEIRKKKAVR